MSLRRNFLSRRIKDRSFTFSCRSLKDFRNVEIGDSDSNFGNDRRILDGRDGNDDAQLDDAAGTVEETASPWSGMLPELLEEIVRRVEVSGEYWPLRQSVVSCACVCKQWRVVTKEVVKSASNSNDSKITFPSCLKKPGPRDFPTQCLIKREKKNAKFYLYLSLSPSFTDKGKFLLAARKVRNGTHTEYIISLEADDFSQGSNAYVGKLRLNNYCNLLESYQHFCSSFFLELPSKQLRARLLESTCQKRSEQQCLCRSDFLGTNFTIYDSQPPHSSAKPSSSRASRRFASKQISPQVPASNFEIGEVSYKFNLLKSRGPRTMICAIKSPWTAEPVIDHLKDDLKEKHDHSAALGYSILRNKTPRWHQHLQCWCLNFHGRVTVASVKNFQLVATVDQSQPGAKGDEEAVLLQFGKVGDDIFTMDFRQPLSAFQAFAICLTSFGTKLGCE